MRLAFLISATIFLIGVLYYTFHKFDGTLDKALSDLERVSKEK
jgi:hypothetical protein